jgi:hypothetical protein
MAATDPGFLRRVLVADAFISGAAGVLMAVGAPVLQPMLGVPATLLQVAGTSLIPFAAFLRYLARREPPDRAWIWAVIALNLAWVAGSAALVVTGHVELTALGYAFVLVQAAMVVAFAEAQYLGLRKLAAP